MEMELNIQNAAPVAAKKLAVKIFGVGSAGITVLEHIAQSPLAGASFVAVSADAESLTRSSVAEKISAMRRARSGGDEDNEAARLRMGVQVLR